MCNVRIVVATLYLVFPNTRSKGGEENAGKKLKTAARLRFWCDNCEVFDLHDTEQCPHEVVRRSNSNGHGAVKQYKLASQVGPSGDRVYCDNCGVFDLHSTDACTEDPMQTF